MPRCSAFCVVVAALVAVPLRVSAQLQPPACIGGTQQSFSATGSLQTYPVPAGTAALLIVANGASGGSGTSQFGDPGVSHGAHIEAGMPVTGPSTLNVVVGSAGSFGFGNGGGGGGSFVFTTTGNLLAAAGAGGGGHQLNAGADAQLGPGGGSGGGAGGGTGGTAGGGAQGGNLFSNNGGGGGGFLAAGGDGAASGSGQGGHQISAPGDAVGGAGNLSGGAGGFGGGGGGGATSGGGGTGGGGGGGGYSGGGGGGGDSGGGGGSFVTAGGTTFASSVLTSIGDGSVTICATATTTEIPTLDVRGLAMLALLLAVLGVVGLRKVI